MPIFAVNGWYLLRTWQKNHQINTGNYSRTCKYISNYNFLVFLLIFTLRWHFRYLHLVRGKLLKGLSWWGAFCGILGLSIILKSPRRPRASQRRSIRKQVIMKLKYLSLRFPPLIYLESPVILKSATILFFQSIEKGEPTMPESRVRQIEV